MRPWVQYLESHREEISRGTLGLGCWEEHFARQKQRLLGHTELPHRKWTALGNCEDLGRDRWGRWGSNTAVHSCPNGRGGLGWTTCCLHGVVRVQSYIEWEGWTEWPLKVWFWESYFLFLRILFSIYLPSPLEEKNKIQKEACRSMAGM